MKQVSAIYYAPEKHWVGNGFQVQTLFSYNDQEAKNIDPFLMLDYNPARHFDGGRKSDFRGVDARPYRGFDIVTFGLQGEMGYEDSQGHRGIIGVGDVQWTTAGKGIMYRTFHSESYSKQGGMFEMMQLWVNLPASEKLAEPKSQLLTSAEIPVVELADNAGTARVIAGALDSVSGNATTFTPINIWNVAMNSGKSHIFSIPENHNLLVYIFDGTLMFNGEDIARRGQLVTFEKGGADVEIESNNESTFLVLTGKPINETIAGHDQFIMNSDMELLQALRDVQSGAFGKITP